jgi:hypothetical protein
MAIEAGSDVEAICRKCGDVWHVVVAMEADGVSIAKVQCKECGGYHKYKAPVSAAEKAAPKKKKTATKRTTKSKAAAPAKPVNQATVEPDLSKPVRPYNVKESFEVAERIDHVKFGIGIVETVLEPGKMEVFFPDGRRVLATAKSAPKLTSLSQNRPAWLDTLKSTPQDG